MSKRIINLRVMQEQYELGAVEEEASWLSQQGQFIRNFLLKNDISTEKLIHKVHYAVVRRREPEK